MISLGDQLWLSETPRETCAPLSGGKMLHLGVCSAALQSGFLLQHHGICVFEVGKHVICVFEVGKQSLE